MKRVSIFVYGVACYAVFFATFLYAIGFVGGFAVPKCLDSAPTMAFWPALGIDLALLGLFAVQHSVMARPGFKRAWTRIVPEPIERSTYVLFSNVAMILLFWLWQPLGGEVWTVENPAARALIYGVYALGWLIVLVSTFLIDHFDLFGLRQVWLHLRGREYTPPRFTELATLLKVTEAALAAIEARSSVAASRARRGEKAAVFTGFPLLLTDAD